MKTIKERKLECLEKTRAIIEANPGITSVWWELMDCDIEEMKTYGLLTPLLDNRLSVNTGYTDSRVVIFAYSKPVKNIKPVEYEV